MEQQEAAHGQPDTGAAGLATELKQQVTEQAHGVAAQAQEAAESQKGRLADGATQVAEALHHASEGLRNDDQQTVGKYAEALAGQAEKVAQFLQSRDLPTMAREVSSFARRQPALFLGGAFTLGIVAARFLKSSKGGVAKSASPAQGSRDFDDEAEAITPEQGSSQRTTDPQGSFDDTDEDRQPVEDGSAGEADEEDAGRPDPELHPPAGVPPLPSANGGGL